jgi:hypothetical protein
LMAASADGPFWLPYLAAVKQSTVHGIRRANSSYGTAAGPGSLAGDTPSVK